MTSPLPIRFFALVAVLPLAVACARGNHTEGSGYGGAGGSGGATATSSSSSSAGTSTTTATTSTSSGGPVCGDGMVDPGEECDGAAPAGKACVGCSIVTVVSPVINEIVYDTSGADVGCFIEILGPPGLDLTGYTLDAVNGSDGTAAVVASLAGHTIGASGYFVLAQDATVSVAAGSNKLIKATADLQNGPDSVVLKSGGAVVDALGYGSFAAGQVFAGEKLPATATSGSLCRIPSGKDSGDNSVDFAPCALTPGASNKLAP
ncbi:MAG: lamin tail domain-containing protein [Byssovorax sp.]